MPDGRARLRSPWAALAAAPLLLSPASARADEPPAWEPGNDATAAVRGEVREQDRPGGDGVYGRFDGDLSFGLAAGAELARGGIGGAARLEAVYFYTVGPYLDYRDAFGSRERGSARSLEAGVDLRPLFLLRWSENQQAGPATLDLLIDSLSLELGAYFAEPAGAAFGDARGLSASAGLSLPLGTQYSGLWLDARVGGRWPDDGEREDFALLTLAWRLNALSPWVRAID